MARGIRSARGVGGGIVSLVTVIEGHGSALEYDLMAMTGRTLSEYLEMGAGGISALCSFIAHIGPGSALYDEVNGAEIRTWGSSARTNTILADIWDSYAKCHKKKGAPDPKYPRPEHGKRGIGTETTISEIEGWFA